jgi:hypothetical protein
MGGQKPEQGNIEPSWNVLTSPDEIPDNDDYNHRDDCDCRQNSKSTAT